MTPNTGELSFSSSILNRILRFFSASVPSLYLAIPDSWNRKVKCCTIYCLLKTGAITIINSLPQCRRWLPNISILNLKRQKLLNLCKEKWYHRLSLTAYKGISSLSSTLVKRISPLWGSITNTLKGFWFTPIPSREYIIFPVPSSKSEKIWNTEEKSWLSDTQFNSY